MHKCRRPRCQAPILLIAHEDSGRVAPIDADPSFGGNVEIIIVRGEDSSENVIGMKYRIVAKEDRGDRQLHKNHFQTCDDPPPRTKRPRE